MIDINVVNVLGISTKKINNKKIDYKILFNNSSFDFIILSRFFI